MHVCKVQVFMKKHLNVLSSCDLNQSLSHRVRLANPNPRGQSLSGLTVSVCPQPEAVSPPSPAPLLQFEPAGC